MVALVDNVSPLACLSLPSPAGSVVKGDGDFVGGAWDKERARIGMVKTKAKKALDAATGVSVVAAQAAFDAAEASRVAHNLLPHVAISHNKKK